MKSLNKLIIITVLGFIAAVILFAVLVRPTLDQIQVLYAQAVQKQTDLQTLSAQILAYKNSQADLNAAQDKNKILDRILPRDNLQTAILEVENGANLAGVTEGLTIDEQFDPTGKLTPVIPMLKGESRATEVSYQLSTSGSFLSMIKFLQYLEHLPHLTEISKIALSATTSTSSPLGLVSHESVIKALINGVFLVKKSSP